MAARALVNPATETIPVDYVFNPCSEATTIYKGTKIATLEEVVEPYICVSAVTTCTTHKSTNTTSTDLNAALWT